MNRVKYDSILGITEISQYLQHNLRALDIVKENKVLIEVRESVNNLEGETSHLDAKGTSPKSKRHNLLKKLGLR
jgi:BMFP domain-containing protein YqiC